MINWISHKINKLTLKKKILYATILVNAVMISAFSVLGLHLALSKYNELLYTSTASSMHYIVKHLSKELNEIVILSNMFRTDVSIQSNLDLVKTLGDANNNKYAEACTKLYSDVQKYYNEYQKRNVNYISLYTKSASQFVAHTYHYKNSGLLASSEADILAKGEAADGAVAWVTDYGTKNAIYLTRKIKKIENLSLDNIGTLVINIDLQKMVQDLVNENNFQGSMWAIYDDDLLISASENFSEEYDLTLSETDLGDYHILKINNEKYFGVVGKINNYPWDYIYMISYQEFVTVRIIIFAIYIIILFISLVLSSLILNVIFKKFTWHFEILINKMKDFRGESTSHTFSLYDYSKRSDEIGILHQKFDAMAKEINELIQNKYVNELLTKNAQIEALETQMNPHFLYNTLESINWRAKEIGEKQISLLVESLGNLFRMTLSNRNEGFTLRKELDLVQYYMTIQVIRFEERLNYSINVSENYLNAKVPKLILQPLVENAVQYALEDIEDECHIILSASYTKNLLNIYVKNSGSSFEDELLEKLKNKDIEARGLGIALLNIDKRIKLTFGNEYGVFFYNEEELAVAKVSIPYKTCQ